MSLFVSELAFGSSAPLDAAKLSILVASLSPGLGGYVVRRATVPVTTEPSRSRSASGA